MSISDPNALINLREVTIASRPVAVLQLEPAELKARGHLIFSEGYDDLDYLVFSMTVLLSGQDITLVRHKNHPGSGTEIWVTLDNETVVETLMEFLARLGLTAEDLSWIHPDYANNRLVAL